MAKIDNKAKYDEFTICQDKHCIGGNEIIKAWHSPLNGWKWFATKAITENKIPQIYEGFVIGDYEEWGSWYAEDMTTFGIVEVPTNRLENMVQFTKS